MLLTSKRFEVFDNAGIFEGVVCLGILIVIAKNYIYRAYSKQANWRSTVRVLVCNQITDRKMLTTTEISKCLGRYS